MMALDGEIHPKMAFFCIFSQKIEDATMNQKEAIIEALKKLGGRAQLSDIYIFIPFG